MDSLVLLREGATKELCFVASVLKIIGVPYALIGATALLLHGVQMSRTTRDLDFIAAVEDTFQHVTEALLEKGFRHGRISHRFYTPQGTQVDVLPVTKRAMETGFIEFPDGERPSALGFSEALTHAEEEQVEHCAVSVAPLPILVALKIFTATKHYGADLQDAIACMRQYEEQGTRRFDNVVYMESLTFEIAGAYLLGRDVLSMISAKALMAIEEALMVPRRSPQPSTRTAGHSEVDSLLQAFASGVGAESL